MIEKEAPEPACQGEQSPITYTIYQDKLAFHLTTHPSFPFLFLCRNTGAKANYAFALKPIDMNMRFFPAGMLAILLALAAQAQTSLEENFSDGNFSENPSWIGESAKFAVFDNRLQLYDQEAASSNTAVLCLPAPTSLDDSTSWTFWIKLDFAPSSSNHAKVFLMASEANLTQPLQGYYLKIGGISGTGDALELYRQDGENHSLLLQGSPDSLGQQPALARVKVTRNREGLWRLYTDYEGGTNWLFEGQTIDTTYARGDYFGWLCQYTSTRNEHFFLDDILITPLYQDTTPPVLLQVEPQSSDSLLLIFDEKLEEVSATHLANYQLSPDIGQPTAAFLDEQDERIVHLLLSQPMKHLHMYSLSAKDIQDGTGNTAAEQIRHFTYYNWPQAQACELLITEIMADPTPPVALPAAEYLELYNNSSSPIQLEQYSLIIGNIDKILPPHLLQPDSFLILCKPEDKEALSVYGNVLPIPDMPKLTNTGTRIEVHNKNRESLHQLTYETSWYADKDKDDGGWSLEMINPAACCRGKENWKASDDLRGGSPGQKNANFLAQADTASAKLLSAYPLSRQLLRLEFDKTLSESSATQLEHYLIEPSLSIDSIWLEEPGSKDLLLLLHTEMQDETLYTLQIQDGLTDCLNYPLQKGQKAHFGWPQMPLAGELVINELLYEPQTGGKDFVELYNTSDKVFDLSRLLLANPYANSNPTQALTATKRLLLPGEIVALSPDPEDLLARYTVPQPQLLLKSPLPTFSPPEGEVTLFYQTEQGELIELERFPYNDQWHNPLLSDTRGISLERLSPSLPANEAGNWSSAATSAGGATPTGENSQRLSFAERQTPKKQKSLFYLEYSFFSPDGDGYQDLLPIRYNIQQTGAWANLLIFDVQGRLCKQLALMLPLGTKGTLLWAGEDDAGQLLPPGTYIAWIECIFADGTVEQHKISCSLAY